MPLGVGDKLGPYEILSLLGKGGMGEVYRARDPRTSRDVAIKISAERFNERFDREIRVVASLNHPNICTLYDVGPNYLVMELVEGESPQGPLPLGIVVSYARQIAAALEEAHEKGIVHRDLKPGNIKIKADGTVKVLDFGLAKIVGTPLGPSENSPTISLAETEVGVILGTVAYMAPEQAKGKPVDKRADLWAFGVVLYEMLTGKRPFTGDTTTEILAAVLEREPKWDRVPDQARPLLRRCLEKDPKLRLRDIGEAMAWLERPPDAPAAEAGIRGRWLWPAVAAVFFAAAAVLAFPYFRPKPAVPAVVTRFEIAQPADLSFGAGLAISPDGRKLAFVATGPSRVPQLWVRSLDAVELRPLAGTENAIGIPFWSWDSRFVVFSSLNRLQKIEASGGPAQTLCSIPAPIRGGFWTPDNRIVFATNSANGLYQVNEAGGTPSALTALAGGETRHSYPMLLRDGRHFVYTSAQSAVTGGIYVGSLEAKPDEQRSKKLLPDVSATAFVPSLDGEFKDGYLLFVRGRALMAQPLDGQGLQLTGEAVPVAERVLPTVFSASSTGVLVYRTGDAAAGTSNLTWFDRQGKAIGTVGNPQGYGELALSPDGAQVAVFRQDSIGEDLWIIELARGSSTRLTSDPGNESYPVWSPDGKQIAFGLRRAANNVYDLYKKPAGASGEEELLLKDDARKFPTDWSRDGRFLLYSSEPNGGKPLGLWVLPMTGDRKPAKYLATEFNELGGRFSPDARWVAYVSDVSKRLEVYVSPFPDAAASPAVLVSTDGGTLPHWWRDGKGLYYLARDRKLMEVEVTLGPSFKVGVPKVLFQTPALGAAGDPIGSLWDVSLDGQRFLVNTAAEQQSVATLMVLTNWQARLKK